MGPLLLRGLGGRRGEVREPHGRVSVDLGRRSPMGLGRVSRHGGGGERGVGQHAWGRDWLARLLGLGVDRLSYQLPSTWG